MKNLFAVLLILCLGSTSCLRLDNNLFNNNANPITEYKLDAYEGPRELPEMNTDTNYHIADSLVHLFQLESNNDGDKANIYAVYIGDISRIASDTVILYCHGNKDHLDLYWNRGKLLAHVGHKHRFGVLMMDYRGYGLSGGKPSESGLYADVDACMQWLKSNGLTNDRLVMYGYSMGTAPATELTANPRTLTPSWLILEAPFASAEVMVQDAARLALPGSYYVNLKIDNAEEIKKVQQPFLWLHGEADDFLDVNRQGAVVAKNYHGVRKTEMRVPNAGHSNVPAIMGLNVYKTTVLNFIKP